MKQTTLSGSFDRYSKTTRRAAFLAEMDRVVPWSVLTGASIIISSIRSAGRAQENLASRSATDGSNPAWSSVRQLWTAGS